KAERRLGLGFDSSRECQRNCGFALLDRGSANGARLRCRTVLLRLAPGQRGDRDGDGQHYPQAVEQRIFTANAYSLHDIHAFELPLAWRAAHHTCDFPYRDKGVKFIPVGHAIYSVYRRYNGRSTRAYPKGGYRDCASTQQLASETSMPAGRCHGDDDRERD